MRPLPVGDPGTPDHRSPTRLLLWLAARTWPTLLGGLGLGTVWMVAQALMPAAVGKAIDAGLRARDLEALIAWGTVLFGLGILQAAAGIARHRLPVWSSSRTAKSSRRAPTGSCWRPSRATPRR